MRFLTTLILLCSGTCTCVLASPSQNQTQHPNIVIILTDDLGYGDVACYNPESKVPTPHLDALAKEGMRFTDAHSPATVCTPTRYALLTGRLSLRTGKFPIFNSLQGPCLIEDERLTLPELLRDAGYATMMSGKWHLGMTFYDKQGEVLSARGSGKVMDADYSHRIDGGPIDHGFDRFYGTANCPATDYLYAYIEDAHVPNPPTKQIDRDKYPKHPFNFQMRHGYASPDFDASEVDMVFLKKSQAFIREHTEANPKKPFFLYHAMHAVHLPTLPAEQFYGKTDAGPHGDFIYMMDHIVGELMNTLKDTGQADNTLVIFCSDNGPEVGTALRMASMFEHDAAHPWRGLKRDSWEGGHRTPMIVKWPGKVEAGTTSDQLISLLDIFATSAAIVGKDYPNDAGEDSYNMLPVFLGKQGDKLVRPYLIQQGHHDSVCIRMGQWKYLPHQGSGSTNYTKKKSGKEGPVHLLLPEQDPHAPGQLYNLADDPGETTNLYSKHPDIVKQLKDRLDASLQSGRSTPSTSASSR